VVGGNKKESPKRRTGRFGGGDSSGERKNGQEHEKKKRQKMGNGDGSTRRGKNPAMEGTKTEHKRGGKKVGGWKRRRGKKGVGVFVKMENGETSWRTKRKGKKKRGRGVDQRQVPESGVEKRKKGPPIGEAKKTVT